MAEFTHLDADGNAVMVDVSEKGETERVATAKGSGNLSNNRPVFIHAQIVP